MLTPILGIDGDSMRACQCARLVSSGWSLNTCSYLPLLSAERLTKQNKRGNETMAWTYGTERFLTMYRAQLDKEDHARITYLNQSRLFHPLHIKSDRTTE